MPSPPRRRAPARGAARLRPTLTRARKPQEFNIEKLQLVEAEKQKIRKEYERKESQVEVKKKMCAPAAPARAPPFALRPRPHAQCHPPGAPATRSCARCALPNRQRLCARAAPARKRSQP